MKADNTKEIRDIAKNLRDAADSADRMAVVLENKDSTEKEIEDATKDFAWQMVKMQTL